MEIIILIVVYSVVCAAYTYVVAKAKGYEGGMWFMGGLLFGLIALIAIIGMPLEGTSIKDDKIDYQKEIENLRKW